MADRIKPPRSSPGKIYSSISIEKRDFSKNTGRLEVKKSNPYVTFCKKIYSKFPGLGKNGKFRPEYKKAIDFLNWNLSDEEYSAAIKFILFFGVSFAIIISYLLFMFAFSYLESAFGSFIMPIIITFLLPILIILIIYNSFQKYPLTKVKSEEIKALTYVPEILGYMIMSMKLVPNLERAVEFASSHGHGKIADDLKNLLWEVKVGIKHSVSEGIDELAYKWGEVSTEFKKALMKIRSSVIENSEAKRYQILDQTMSETLKSIKEKLEDYARSLSQPSMGIFYLGVLLPLLLIIVLPVGSAFSGSALAKPIYLILLYNIVIPIGCLFYAKKIIRNKPSTYRPPKIPNNHPKLPPKHTIRVGKAHIHVSILIIIVCVIFISGSVFLQSEFGQTKKSRLIQSGYITDKQSIDEADFYCTKAELIEKAADPEFKCASELEFWARSENSITPHFIIYGMLILISLIISIMLYSQSKYKREIQLETEKMEDEFKDALYVIASRLGENKPIEDALSHTKNFLPKALISKNIFGKAIDNIRVLGLNLNSALFDPSYGALKNNPSNLINSAMRLLVDSVQLGVSVAAKTLMSYSLQLRNTDEVTKMLRDLISSVTTTLKSMSKFIAPVVLGITTALQKIVISTLYSIANSNAMEDMTSAIEGVKDGVSAIGVNVNASSVSSMGSIDTAVISQLASPTAFLIIVAIYVIQVVIIITFFTTMIEQDNITLAKLNIARTLPIATILFIITTIVANMIF